ncbi:hypothetical protein BH24ACT18_BH24ACT18_04970 [soil metagenome]
MSLLIQVMPTMYRMKIPIRIAPSIRLNRMGFSMLVPRRAPRPFVPKTGATRKSPKPSTSAKRSVPAISFLESSSSSPSAMFVESVSAFIPSQSVSPRERAPRMMGNRNSLLLRVTERKGSARSSTLPSGARTAIPQKLGERISTPSIMAWPPTLKRCPYARFWRAWRRFSKRCTRPPVSTMRCLPV